MNNKPYLTLFLCIAGSIAALYILAGCSHPRTNHAQGYIEGEYVYVSSPYPGALRTLYAQKGSTVKTGDPLFMLESASEKAGRDEAERRLAQARANLEDMKKGKRASEIESINAQIKQAKEALALSEKELEKQEKLFLSGLISVQDIDQIRSTHYQNQQKEKQAEADLKTALLGARPDQIAAAEANLHAMESALSKTEWDLSQKKQIAPQEGIVFDTFYQVGEWVAAGRPVVALLPPQNIKLRTFVPETMLSKIHLGDGLKVNIDGVEGHLTGKVSFISPQAEFTPPVIYSKESRSKMVFLIEAIFDPEISSKLHPGQPVDVEFGF